MALETLKNADRIGGFLVDHCCTASNTSPIAIDSIANEITFRIQNGPIKEVGVNGCQVLTMIETAKLIIEGLNKQFPCCENSMVITKLDEALLWSMKRTLDRDSRNLEGTNQV